MARYQYRHTIDVDDDATLSDEGRAIIKAAFAVAERAHFGQSRNKIEPEWQYICHPIMVYDIMRKLGEDDPAVLAAAILHDSIEDFSDYKANPELMCDELISCLYHEGIMDAADDKPPHDGRAHQLTQQISDLCREVTNPEIFDGEGIKENYQIDRVSGMSFAAKKIKIADQAASLICNLTMANDPTKFTPEQELQFTEKADALVIRIFQSVQDTPKEREALKPYASMFGKALLNVLPLVSSKNEEQKAEVRTLFDFDRLFDQKQYINILPDAVQAANRIYIDSDDKRKGLTWIDLDNNGDVVRYALWADWHDKGADANAIQKFMTTEIREKRRMGEPQMEGDLPPERAVLLPGRTIAVAAEKGEAIGGMERIFDLHPSMKGMAFVAAAYAAKAIRTKERDELNNLFFTNRQKGPDRHPRITALPAGEAYRC